MSGERVIDCDRCGNLCITTEASRNGDRSRCCPPCRAVAKLLAVADNLVKWKSTVDVVSGTDAADQLYAIVEQAKTAADEARAL